MSVERILNGFLRQVVDDRSSGHLRPLAEYQAMFPGHDDLLAERYPGYATPSAPPAVRSGLPGLEMIGPYRIERELGRGGQGIVYLAEDERLRRKVALKVLTGSWSLATDRFARFVREAQVASRLDHPGIATVYEIATHAGLPCITMRYVDGEALTTWVARVKEMSTPKEAVMRILAVAEAAARAIHAAHEAGIIHRDIKPGNIIVGGDDAPVILDFGLAQDVEGDQPALTRTGDLMGTPAYMSPEQIATHRVLIDRRTDVHSLGVSLFECLAGRRPFEAPTREGLYRSIATAEPADLRRLNPAVPADLRVVVATAIAKERDRRYQTALDLAEELRRVRTSEPIVARAAGPWVRVERWSRRNPGLAAALSALFLVLVAGLTVAIIQRNDRQAALADYERLGDLSRLDQLRRGAEDLWPCNRGKVSAMKAWLEQAAPLATRLPQHEASLDHVRTQAIRVPGSDSRSGHAGLTWRFDSDALQFKHDTTAKVVASLREFLDPDPAKGLLADVRARLAFSETVERETVRNEEARWAEAIASIADVRECPKYGGLRVRPQVGLIPIGRDAASGLWEFVHLQTHTPGTVPVPRRGVNGRLVVTEDTGLVLVLLPGGTFRMGAVRPPDEDTLATAPNVDPEAEIDGREGPVTSVILEPFFLSKYEMTQGQWLRTARQNPSRYAMHPDRWIKPIDLRNPVEQVSWDECDLWLRRLELIIPTEAQWEYAARGGTTTPRWTGIGTEGLAQAANLADAFAREHGGPSHWHYESWDDGFLVHAPVGSFAPNPFGLHDVFGNVSEWCRDWFTPIDTPDEPGDGMRSNKDPDLSSRAFRGGSFSCEASFARASVRWNTSPDSHDAYLGIPPARRLVN